MAEVIAEDGLALHVFDTANGDERLRFDCFEDAPHYHFLDPGPPTNVVMDHDAASGPLLDRALGWLRADLAGLLRRAGAADLAAAIEPGTVSAAVDVVAQTARYVSAAGRPVVVR